MSWRLRFQKHGAFLSVGWIGLIFVLGGCGNPVSQSPLVESTAANATAERPAVSAARPAGVREQADKPSVEVANASDEATEASDPRASAEDSPAPPAPVGPNDASRHLTALSEAFRDIAQRVKPCVVQVSAEIRPGARLSRLDARTSEAEREQLARRFGPLLELNPELAPFFRGSPFPREGPDYEQYNVPLPVSAASGWVYDDAGHIVTNHHVVARADRITVTFHDEGKAEAQVVGSDPQTDVAVLQCEKDGLEPARLANRKVNQGDIVLAVGSPFHYAFSVSQGIVSATGRRMGILGPRGYEDFIQTDAAINPGNSGGPLTNARGEVVGMSTAIASRSGAFAGVGFAIPVQMIRSVVAELIANGKIRRGYLGALISDDKDLLASFGVEGGVLVEDVVEDGPADHAGLKPGDVIAELDGKAARSAAELRRRVAQTDPGKQVDVKAVREGKPVDFQVTLAEQPSQEDQPELRRRPPQSPAANMPEGEPLGKLGFQQLLTLTDEIARQHGIDPAEGVLVLAVRPFSAAAAAGIRRGQIITHVVQQRIRSVEELSQAVEGQDLSKGVRVRVAIPGGPARFVLLSLSD